MPLLGWVHKLDRKHVIIKEICSGLGNQSLWRYFYFICENQLEKVRFTCLNDEEISLQVWKEFFGYKFLKEIFKILDFFISQTPPPAKKGGF